MILIRSYLFALIDLNTKVLILLLWKRLLFLLILLLSTLKNLYIISLWSLEEASIFRSFKYGLFRNRLLSWWLLRHTGFLLSSNFLLCCASQISFSILTFIIWLWNLIYPFWSTRYLSRYPMTLSTIWNSLISLLRIFFYQLLEIIWTKFSLYFWGTFIDCSFSSVSVLTSWWSFERFSASYIWSLLRLNLLRLSSLYFFHSLYSF